MVRWLAGIGVVAGVLARAPEARACSPWDASLDATVPAAGGVIARGAVLILEGQVLKPEHLEVTVDGAPALLEIAVERSVEIDYFGWDPAFRTMALRVVPTPEVGQTFIVTGDPCIQYDGMSFCPEVELAFTVGEADLVPPEPPIELWYDVYDNLQDAQPMGSCGGPTARFEITVQVQLAKGDVERPFEYRVSRRPRTSADEWESIAHDWRFDEQTRDPEVRLLYLLDEAMALLPLTEAFCFRAQTYDTSENLGGTLEVCPPCRERVGEDVGGGFIANWPDQAPGYDTAPLYPDGHCPPFDAEDGESSTSGVETSSSSSDTSTTAEGGASEVSDRGCACAATRSREGDAIAAFVGVIVMLRRRRDRRYSGSTHAPTYS